MSVQFESLFRHSPNAYMVLDRHLRYVEANHAYERLTGLRREQLLGRGLFELFPGTRNDDGSSQADVLRHSLERVLATGERDVLALIPYAIPTDTADGPAVELRFWSATHEPVRDEAGNVVGVLQHTSDVTEVERLRQEVRRARAADGQTQEQMTHGVLTRAAVVQQDNRRLSARQAFLIDLFEQAPGFMAVLRGPDHVFELANAAYLDLIGGRSVVGKPVREALPEIDGQGFYELLDQVRERGEAFIGRALPIDLRDRTGATRTLHVDFIYQPIRDAQGRVDGIFVQGADVTEREALLGRLRESEAGLRTVTDLVPQMVWSAGADGEVNYYNRRWYEVTGVREGESDGSAWGALLHPDDRERVLERWRHSIATGTPYEAEYRLRHADGEYGWWLGRSLPVHDDSGTIVRWLGTCTDIDEIKRAQQMLEASQAALRAADRHKDQFLATLAHELRNPLAPITAAAQLLLMAPDRVDTVHRTAEIVARQAAHMRNLVEDLVDVSRVTRGLVALQPLATTVTDAVLRAVEQTAPLMEQRGHRLVMDDRVPGLGVFADPTRLTQIVANLLNNAAKYTPPGGVVTVEVSSEDDDVVVRVRDTGVGMDDALIDRVFELFVQAEGTPERHAGGLGLGLALARSLAQLHGGDLTATSAGPGQGSTFELRVPRQPALVAPA